MKQWLMSWFWVLLCSVAARGRDVPMLHYTREDGLPSNMVYNICQDNQGYIWLATDKGICRYNGQRFEKYNTNNGLTDNECFSFHKDPNNRLWISTFSGALMFYQDGIFHTESNTPYLKLPFKDGRLDFFRLEKDSSITIFFSGNSLILSVLEHSIRYYDIRKLRSQFSSFRLQGLTKSGPGTMDLYLADTVVRIDTAANVIAKWINPHGLLVTHRRGQDEGYYLLNDNIVDDSFKIIKRLPPGFTKSYIVNEFYRDGALAFVSTNHGLWVGDAFLLQGHDVSAVGKDKDGNYWITTLDDGIYKISASFLQAGLVSNAYGAKVQHAVVDKGLLLFTTKKGNTYSCKGEKVALLAERNVKNKIPAVSGQYFLDGQYLSFYNTALFAMHHTGQDQFHTRVFRLFSGTEKGLFFNKAKQVQASPSSIYLLASEGTIYKVSRDKVLGPPDKIELSKIYPADLLAKENIYGVARTPDSTCWFSTTTRVYRLTDTAAVLQPQFGAISFKELFINKDLLVGYTFNNQLLISNRYTGKDINIDSSVHADCIWDKFYAVNDSIILVSTDNYYRLITTHHSAGKPAYTIRVLEDPLVPQLAEYIVSDGATCYFFNKGSITYLPVTALLKQPEAPALFFTRLKDRDSIYAVRPSMHLAYYTSRDISIGFSTLFFIQPGLSYEYSITNPDVLPARWEKSNGADINLYKVSPGSYKISIRAKTPAGIYYSGPSFLLSIGPPFWLTWWFIGCCLLVLILLAGLLLRYYIRRAMRIKASELKFMRSEFTALNALMNPHFVFNTLNSLQSLINKNEQQQASEYVRTVADLIRQNMHNISMELIPLEKEMILVANYLRLEQLRFEWLKYNIDVSDEVDISDLLVPPLLVQPLVENAIIHGLWPAVSDHKEIRIHIYQDGNAICVDVIDNGRGFSQRREENGPAHQSMAMSNIRQRLQQLSLMYRRQFLFELEELKNNEGKVLGVKAAIRILE